LFISCRLTENAWPATEKLLSNAGGKLPHVKARLPLFLQLHLLITKIITNGIMLDLSTGHSQLGAFIILSLLLLLLLLFALRGNNNSSLGQTIPLLLLLPYMLNLSTKHLTLLLLVVALILVAQLVHPFSFRLLLKLRSLLGVLKPTIQLQKMLSSKSILLLGFSLLQCMDMATLLLLPLLLLQQTQRCPRQLLFLSSNLFLKEAMQRLRLSLPTMQLLLVVVLESTMVQ
jgi:hypothetical protein